MDSILFWRVSLESVLLWGFLANIVLTTIMYTGQGIGFSRMSLPFMLGTVFTPNRSRAEIIGFGAHFLVGWFFTFIYAMTFEALQQSAWWIGLVIGLIHWAFMFTAIIPILPHAHPRMSSEHTGPTPTRMLEPPGFLALNYGRRTPLVSLLAHLAFGAILGAFYQLNPAC